MIGDKFQGELLLENLMTTAKHFILSESLKRKPKQPKKAAGQPGVSPTPAKKTNEGEKGKKRLDAITAYARVFPTSAVPNHARATKDGTMIKIMYTNQSDRDSVKHGEAQSIVDEMSTKDQGALIQIASAVLENRKYLSSKEYRDDVKLLAESDENLENPEKFFKTSKVAFNDTPYKGHGSVLALKQYLTLQGKEMLLSESHIRTYLRLVQGSVKELKNQPDAIWHDDEFSRLLKANPGTSRREICNAMATPTWKRGELLGAFHPRIIALQCRDMITLGTMKPDVSGAICNQLVNKELKWFFTSLTLAQPDFKPREPPPPPKEEPAAKNAGAPPDR